MTDGQRVQVALIPAATRDFPDRKGFLQKMRRDPKNVLEVDSGRKKNTSGPIEFIYFSLLSLMECLILQPKPVAVGRMEWTWQKEASRARVE